MPLRPSRKPVWTILQRWLPLAGAIATPSWRWEAVAHLWRSSASSVAANRPRRPCYATVGWQPRTWLCPPPRRGRARAGVRYLPLWHVRVCLNLYQHLRVNEPADLDHGRRRTDGAKAFAMCLAHLFPVLDIDHIHACPYHVGERRSCLHERRLNGAQGLDSLRIRISDSDHPCGCHGRCPSHMHVRTHPDSARIPDTRLPGTTTGDVQTLHHMCPPEDFALR